MPRQFFQAESIVLCGQEMRKLSVFIPWKKNFRSRRSVLARDEQPRPTRRLGPQGSEMLAFLCDNYERHALSVFHKKIHRRID